MAPRPELELQGCTDRRTRRARGQDAEPSVEVDRTIDDRTCARVVGLAVFQETVQALHAGRGEN